MKTEALLAGERHLLEMVATGAALPVILDGVCQLVERIAPGCRCSILQVDDVGLAVRHSAAPSLPATFTMAIDGRDTSRPYWGPCAMAVAERMQVIVPDVSADTRWRASEWRALALTHGLHSCWTTPITSRTGSALGTFAVYRPLPGTPTPAQQELTERLTHLTSIAIEHGQTVTALRRSEAHLVEAQRLSLTGSFTWRVAKGEILWSEQAYRIYDIDPTRPVTFDLVFTRIHPEEAAWFRDLLTQAASEGRDLEFEHRLRMPDHAVKYLHVVAHAGRDKDGNLEYIGAVQDVTERRRSEESLNRLRSELAHIARVATLGALTASIAHEVNQPLTGIMTNASASLLMLSDTPANVQGAVESAQRTIRDAERASQVIARLRTLFRKTDASIEAFDLNESTSEVLALSQRELEKSRIDVRTEFQADLPRVVGDRVQLQQVVLNLVLNAAEAMSLVDPGRRQLLVQTTMADAGERICLSVRDSGPGVSPGDEQRIFRNFFTTKANGMGVGLAISRAIIEQHGGRLWLTNHRDAGATFSFSIPRVADLHRPRHVDDPPMAGGATWLL